MATPKDGVWQRLNEELMQADARGVATMLDAELRGERRSYVLRRLATRYGRLVSAEIVERAVFAADNPDVVFNFEALLGDVLSKITLG
jgi:hypothetical protein